MQCARARAFCSECLSRRRRCCCCCSCSGSDDGNDNHHHHQSFDANTNIRALAGLLMDLGYALHCAALTRRCEQVCVRARDDPTHCAKALAHAFVHVSLGDRNNSRKTFYALAYLSACLPACLPVASRERTQIRPVARVRVPLVGCRIRARVNHLRAAKPALGGGARAIMRAASSSETLSIQYNNNNSNNSAHCGGLTCVRVCARALELKLKANRFARERRRRRRRSCVRAFVRFLAF